MTDETLARLSQKSKPIQTTFNKPSIPTIKLDGLKESETFGQFIMYEGSGDSLKVIPLGKTLNIRIIRQKKRLEFANDTSKFSTGEYDSPLNEELTLRKYNFGGKDKAEIVTKGNAKSIREAYPDIKTIALSYGIVDDKLVRLVVKGTSAAGDEGLYSYLDSFKGDNVFLYNTIITTKLVVKNRAVSYYKMEFERGTLNKNNLEQVESYLDIVNGEVDNTVQSTTDTTTDDATDVDLSTW